MNKRRFKILPFSVFDVLMWIEPITSPPPPPHSHLYASHTRPGPITYLIIDLDHLINGVFPVSIYAEQSAFSSREKTLSSSLVHGRCSSMCHSLEQSEILGSL